MKSLVLFLSCCFLFAGSAFSIDLEPGWPRATGYSVSQSGTAAQFDTDPEFEIALASQDGSAYLYNHDGTLLPGWPRYMGGALGPDPYINQCSSPAVYDLDGDGQNEMIVGNFDGRMYVFNADASLVPGWPFTAGWMIFSTPAVGDIDGDHQPEVVFGANDGRIYALNANGSMCAGFPIITPYVVRSSPALGDLDGDGFDEIAITADNSDYHLYVLDGDGTALPGYPKLLGVGAISSPSLGDVNHDGDLEIVVGSRDGALHVLNHDGTYLPGWPLPAGYSLQSSPTLVNLAGDPELEIIVGLNDSKVSVYNTDGTLLPGWPQTTSYSVLSSASVGDIDGDGGLEIVIGENTGKVYAWNVDGTLVPGFPLLDATYTIYSSPLLEDLDLDGHLELLVGCNDTWIYCWDLGAGTYNPDLLPWPKWRLHADNDATYDPIDPAAAPEPVIAAGFGTVSVFPNPMVNSATLRYRLSGGGPAVLTWFDAGGRAVRRIPHDAAQDVVTWRGDDEAGHPVAPGVYLYRLEAGTQVATGRVVVIR